MNCLLYTSSIGEISSITTNTMEILGDVAARVVMLTMQGILETSMIILMLFLFDWRIGLIAAAGVLIFFGVNLSLIHISESVHHHRIFWSGP